MDPDATWALMLEAYASADWQEATDHAEALMNWLRNGGFPPLTTIASKDGSLAIEIDDRQANFAIADGVARAISRSARAKSNGS